MEDYSRRVGISSILIILMLIAIGYIPARTIGGIELKQINILSQLSTPNNSTSTPSLAIPDKTLDFDEGEFEVDLLQVSATVAHTRELLALHTPDEAQYPTPPPTPSEELAPTNINPTPLLPNTKLTPIENFDTTALNPFSRLFTKLSTPSSQVRIALLGDSFVEGDILSCDLREILQSRYGGCGAGFTPTDSPLTRYRRTIKTTSSGWTTHNIMQRRTTPAELAPNYYVSGWVSSPTTSGAVTRWEGSTSRQYLTHWNTSRLLFMSRKDSKIEVTINDSETTTHSISGKDNIQQLIFTADSIYSLSAKIISGAEGFIGYGAIHESGVKGGITLDNYSVRSNNGQAILWTNPSINTQIDHLIGGYDLVILQYGLNIMQKGVTNYSRYSQQIEKMISFCRECFPHAAILIMGVSDRSIKENGSYLPMSEATNLTHYQRQAAQNCAAAFWSTYDAMQAQGGMPNFVTQEWAAKDYTHINLAGGRQIAMALADALIHAHLGTCEVIIRNDFDNVIPESDKDSMFNNL